MNTEILKLNSTVIDWCCVFLFVIIISIGLYNLILLTAKFISHDSPIINNICASLKERHVNSVN